MSAALSFRTEPLQQTISGRLKIVLAIKGITPPVVSENPFPDVTPPAWYVNHIAKAKELGWVHGYPDGTFHPNSSITRAESLQILSSALGVDVSGLDGTSGFVDVVAGSWYAPYVAWAKNNGIVNGIGGGTVFAPHRAVTRAEFAKMAVIAFGL